MLTKNGKLLVGNEIKNWLDSLLPNEEIENGGFFIPSNNFVAQGSQKLMQNGQRREILKLRLQGIQNGTKDGFRVGLTDRMVMNSANCGLSQQWLLFLVSRIVEFRNLTVVSKSPLDTP